MKEGREARGPAKMDEAFCPPAVPAPCRGPFGDKESVPTIMFSD